MDELEAHLCRPDFGRMDGARNEHDGLALFEDLLALERAMCSVRGLAGTMVLKVEAFLDVLVDIQISHR